MTRPGFGLGARLPGARAGIVLLILGAGWIASASLGLRMGDLVPGPGGLGLLREFFARAFTPALVYEAHEVPAGTLPLLVKALMAAYRTLLFAAAAASLSLVLGVPLGVLASQSFWSLRGIGTGRWGAWFRYLGRVGYFAARAWIALMRSVHELLWAVLLLAALGFSPLAAIVAIAIPYGGTLAKVFSEIVDEVPKEAAKALELSGAGALQVFCFGLIPMALPDLSSYAMYRFECAVRSSAVLGFFGFPTLGFYLAASFENLHYGEVWTYLYALFGLVLLLDAWSGALRERLTA